MHLDFTLYLKFSSAIWNYEYMAWEYSSYFFNSNKKAHAGQSKNGLIFKYDFLESLFSWYTNVCDGS